MERPTVWARKWVESSSTVVSTSMCGHRNPWSAWTATTLWSSGALSTRIAGFQPRRLWSTVWLFSCGPLHSSDRPVNVTSDAAHAVSLMHATAHRTFPGKLVPERLSAGERQIFENSGAVAGDFRDWVLVCNWAREILAWLNAEKRGS
jgi:hypothetical protein